MMFSDQRQSTTFAIRVALIASFSLTCLLIIDCHRHRLFESEQAVISDLRILQAAEQSFYATHGTYADLNDLGSDGASLIPRDLSLGARGEYEVRVTASTSGYSVTARYCGREAKATHRSFYMDQTGVIRETLGPGAATAKSSRIDGQSN